MLRALFLTCALSLAAVPAHAVLRGPSLATGSAILSLTAAGGAESGVRGTVTIEATVGHKAGQIDAALTLTLPRK
ncbi:MAG: hypothetical protein KDK12_14660 [Rhodobacteraceae bacterium]|nr:hypothetical protein [Paracoccaceae bacterium]